MNCNGWSNLVNLHLQTLVDSKKRIILNTQDNKRFFIEELKYIPKFEIPLYNLS